jgi:hypothetical protein
MRNFCPQQWSSTVFIATGKGIEKTSQFVLFFQGQDYREEHFFLSNRRWKFGRFLRTWKECLSFTSWITRQVSHVLFQINYYLGMSLDSRIFSLERARPSFFSPSPPSSFPSSNQRFCRLGAGLIISNNVWGEEREGCLVYKGLRLEPPALTTVPAQRRNRTNPPPPPLLEAVLDAQACDIKYCCLEVKQWFSAVTQWFIHTASH